MPIKCIRICSTNHNFLLVLLHMHMTSQAPKLSTKNWMFFAIVGIFRMFREIIAPFSKRHRTSVTTLSHVCHYYSNSFDIIPL